MSITAMKLALEALETLNSGDTYKTHNAATALRQAIAEAEQEQESVTYPENFIDALRYDTALRDFEHEQAQKQEPVAWEEVLGAVARGWCYEENANKTIDEQLAIAIATEVQSLFIAPPQRKPWVGLTDDEVRQMCGSVPTLREAVREAEAKLKDRNT